MFSLETPAADTLRPALSRWHRALVLFHAIGCAAALSCFFL
jgi:hypothetical protein